VRQLLNDPTRSRHDCPAIFMRNGVLARASATLRQEPVAPPLIQSRLIPVSLRPCCLWNVNRDVHLVSAFH
jgi:hypothetical protein